MLSHHAAWPKTHSTESSEVWPDLSLFPKANHVGMSSGFLSWLSVRTSSRTQGKGLPASYFSHLALRKCFMTNLRKHGAFSVSQIFSMERYYFVTGYIDVAIIKQENITSLNAVCPVSNPGWMWKLKQRPGNERLVRRVVLQEKAFIHGHYTAPRAKGKLRWIFEAKEQGHHLFAIG